MKKYFTCLSFSCTSVKEYNKKIEEPIPIVKLKQDVDFANKKLQKFHPNLYWYITKNQLDYKFDSLKQTIKQPLKPSEFYLKLAPIIADVREGHLRLVPLEKNSPKRKPKN
jgi:glucose-6-phosphate 1-dehydrogenase